MQLIDLFTSCWQVGWKNLNPVKAYIINHRRSLAPKSNDSETRLLSIPSVPDGLGQERMWEHVMSFAIN